MLIFALIYWSIILLVGLFFFVKALKGIYNYIIYICRKFILTRFLVAIPLRLVINTIGSLGIGILIFFHAVFFACIIGFIYGMMGGNSQLIIKMISYTCVGILLLPIIISIIKTVREEIAFSNEQN